MRSGGRGSVKNKVGGSGVGVLVGIIVVVFVGMNVAVADGLACGGVCVTALG